MGVSSAGVILAVVLLVVPNASGGSAPTTRSGISGLTWVPTAYSVSNFTSHLGCQRGGYSAAPVFYPGSDRLRFGSHGKAEDCATGSAAPHTSESSLTQITYVAFGLDFLAPHNGSLSIRENWTTSIDSAFSTIVTPCPAKILPVNPPSTSAGYCAAEMERQFELQTNVGGNGVSNGFEPIPSQFEEGDSLGWENYTTCGSGPSGFGWSCATMVGNFDSPSHLFDRARPAGDFLWNGTSNFSVWVNVSGLAKGTNYELAFYLQVALIVFAGEYSLSQDWRGVGTGYLRLARPGTFAQLDGVSLT